MPTTASALNLAITNYFLDHWHETPLTKPSTGGIDMTGTLGSGMSVYDADCDFVEFNFHVTSRDPTGVGRETGSKSFGVLQVEIFTAKGTGDMSMTRLEEMIYTLFERKTINTAQIRAAAGVSRPYEHRGRLAKSIAFPVEFFTINQPPC